MRIFRTFYCEFSKSRGTRNSGQKVSALTLSTIMEKTLQTLVKTLRPLEKKNTLTADWTYSTLSWKTLRPLFTFRPLVKTLRSPKHTFIRGIEVIFIEEPKYLDERSLFSESGRSCSGGSAEVPWEVLIYMSLRFETSPTLKVSIILVSGRKVPGHWGLYVRGLFDLDSIILHFLY